MPEMMHEGDGMDYCEECSLADYCQREWQLDDPAIVKKLPDSTNNSQVQV